MSEPIKQQRAALISARRINPECRKSRCLRTAVDRQGVGTEFAVFLCRRAHEFAGRRLVARSDPARPPVLPGWDPAFDPGTGF